MAPCLRAESRSEVGLEISRVNLDVVVVGMNLYFRNEAERFSRTDYVPPFAARGNLHFRVSSKLLPV